jgi:NodT family efflux transporter outer membrane factor (OMF) lipoprotein
MGMAIRRHDFGVRLCASLGVVPCALAVLTVSGCGLGEWARNGMKVGPNYKKPVAPISEGWIDYRDTRVNSEDQNLGQWWDVFHDPVLNALIADAAQQNLSVRAAGERIVQARARRGIAVGNLFPQVQQATGSYSANKVSNQAGNAQGFNNQWFQSWDAGFNASWELDLWGRFRRSIEAADANLEASVADYDDVMVVLLADVSANYVQYRTFQERIAVARRNIGIQEKSYQLAQDKFQAGAATERDAQQAKQVLEETRASIPPLEVGARQANNALCVLLGMPVRDLSDRFGVEPSKIPSAPPELAIGIPADLLRRRPDVRRSERRAAAQSAQIGVAKSDLYPRFAINGSIGVAAENFGDLFHTPGSMFGSIGPSFQWDILNYGRIENNVAIQESQFRQAVLAYQDSVLRANRESEDAIVGFLKAQERAQALNLSVAAADRTVQITHDQYREGVIDFTPVFLFEGTLAQQQDELALARGQIALNLVDLYRSLGGGWQMRLEGNAADSSKPAATTQTAAVLGP